MLYGVKNNIAYKVLCKLYLNDEYGRMVGCYEDTES